VRPGLLSHCVLLGLPTADPTAHDSYIYIYIEREPKSNSHEIFSFVLLFRRFQIQVVKCTKGETTEVVAVN